MNSEKIDNQLNLALDLPNEVREKTLDLDVGFNPANQTWEVIVKYSGSLERIATELNASVTELINEYAIVVIRQDLIDRLSTYEEIEFIEKPKRLFYEVNNGRAASCIQPLQTAQYNLFGEGVIVGIIDSGIDYSHPDFRNEDGSSRILYLWDQSIAGKPPEGYTSGTVYTKEQIDEALKQPTKPQQLQLVPSTDLSGHGTHVAGIAAGNGRGSGGRYRGVASQSELIVVKLGLSISRSFPTTTQLMEALDFIIRTATSLRKPVAVNISFGNNYGSHDGTSVLENYMDDVSNLWKSSICVGTGNEGSASRHSKGVLTMGTTQEVQLAISENEPTFNLQIWRNYYDFFDVEIEAPNGRRIGPIPSELGTQTFSIGDTNIFLYYGEPSPISIAQETYFEFIPKRNFIDPGIWRIRLIPRKIVTGNYNMWLPTGATLNAATRFLDPSVETTLTIPSTATKVISVGAYDSATDSLAYFSGRGFTRNNTSVKPDIVAPGVNIMSASPGGGYTQRSGTSMATPFVTGSAALLLQWGIVEGNDPFLYGQKIRAYLIAGARHLPIERQYPNPTLGFGALCLRDSLLSGSV